MIEKIVANAFAQRKILLKNLAELPAREFCKKRGLRLFLGVDLRGFYTLVLWRTARSRLVVGEFAALGELCAAVEKSRGFNVKKRICFYQSALCGKVKIAAQAARESGVSWKFYAFCADGGGEAGAKNGENYGENGGEIDGGICE